MADYSIPFNKPYLSGKELDYIAEAVRQGHASGDGPFTKRCQDLLEEITGAPTALLTTSCTHALELCGMLLDFQPGDEVIIPSFTFVSTVNAFMLGGAKPVFADIRPDTLNIDEALLPELVTPKTRAVVVVHYAGIGCEMDSVTALSEEHGFSIIEDNAHGLFGAYRSKNLGTFGSMATLSFHETKNISCGEGGALLINDPAYIERAEILREKGTDRKRFFRGEVDKYSWVDVGSSYLPSDLLAAYLLAQLEERDNIQRRRKEIWERYHEALKEWAAGHAVRQQAVPAHCDQSYHMYHLVMASEGQRAALIAHLKERGILSVFHYQPLHSAPMAIRSGIEAHCPVTEDMSTRLLRLPFFNGMSDEEQQRVIESILEFQEP